MAHYSADVSLAGGRFIPLCRPSSEKFIIYDELCSIYSVDTCADNVCNSGMGKGARSCLARKLRLLRMVRGWTQEELAHASGLHRTYVSLIERAECSVTLDNLERLADTFNLTLSELLDATDPAGVDKRSLSTLNKTGRKKRCR